MVFSSYIFLFIFLPCALILYYISPRKIKHLTLTLISYVFYGWANPLFMLLMLFSTIVDYICGLFISNAWQIGIKEKIPILSNNGKRTKVQRGALIISICTNLGLLAFFKYFNFSVDNYNWLVANLGLGDYAVDSVMRIILPLGISFYTFQSMSYSIDVYRGDARAIRNFIDFACYVSMFPQLVAGPIIRFQEIADQLQYRSHTLEKFSRGVAFFCLGFGKKIILANPCGKISDSAFDAVSVSVFDAWYGAVAYAFQIYFDFSGYTDMAIGLGLMLGFVFPKNFDSPYLSKSITEFWRRWHLSLSFWLRDYLYIPLGGNKKGTVRTYFNLIIVMLIGGMWHGASWSFIVWGAIHGTMLIIERLQGKNSFYRSFPSVIRIAITFIIVLFTWVFFRADTLPDAWEYCRSMLGVGSENASAGVIRGIIYSPYCILSFIIAALFVWFAPQTWDFTRKISGIKILWIIIVFLISIALLISQEYNPFIYFIF